MPPRPRRLPLEPPPALRAQVIELNGEQYLIASYPAGGDSPVHGLSPAESAVLSAALSGSSNAEIALSRGRSVNTIQNQIASALRKLGVSSRSEAAAVLAARRRR